MFFNLLSMCLIFTVLLIITDSNFSLNAFVNHIFCRTFMYPLVKAVGKLSRKYVSFFQRGNSFGRICI